MITRTLHRRLAAISDELIALREEAAILAEQLAFAQEVMEETRLRALVAETPLAERDLRIASDDVRRIARFVAELDVQRARLVEEQDRLLGEVAGATATEA